MATGKKLLALAALFIGLTATLHSGALRLGIRGAGGWSQDTGDDAEGWDKLPIVGGGLQLEWDSAPRGFVALEAAYDQAGRSNRQPLLAYDSGGQLAGTVAAGRAHWVEDEMAESLLLGWRGYSGDAPGTSAGWLHPRAYIGLQFTQVLDARHDESTGVYSAAWDSYPDQDQRYRSFALVGLGLGLGRSDGVVLDLRGSQEAWHQRGDGVSYAKAQLGLTWFLDVARPVPAARPRAARPTSARWRAVPPPPLLPPLPSAAQRVAPARVQAQPMVKPGHAVKKKFQRTRKPKPKAKPKSKQRPKKKKKRAQTHDLWVEPPD